MKATLKRIDGRWTLIIERKGGTNDYRFSNKLEAKRWAKSVGIELQEE